MIRNDLRSFSLPRTWSSASIRKYDWLVEGIDGRKAYYSNESSERFESKTTTEGMGASVTALKRITPTPTMDLSKTVVVKGHAGHGKGKHRMDR